MRNDLLGQGAQENQAILPETQAQPYTSLTHYTLAKKATWGKLWMLWELNAEHEKSTHFLFSMKVSNSVLFQVVYFANKRKNPNTNKL